MRIGIDARMYGPKISGAGIGRYVEEVIGALQQVDDEHEYVVFLRKKNFADCPIPNRRWKKVVADVPWYGLVEQMWMPGIIRHQKLDVMHFPHFNVPVRTETPYIVTLHDLTMLEQAWDNGATTRGRFLYELKQRGQRYILNRIAQDARAIVTVSEHAKNAIIHRLPVSADRVHVVYNGIDRATDWAHKTKTKTVADALPGGIKTPFILNVGNPYPHKNIETLLHAFSFFVREYPQVHLALVGPHNTFTERLKREAREIEIPEDRIHFVGFVDDETLSRLYHEAALYVIPSKMEGFGLPPLEALAHGTPVAASRASSIPEILGSAAVYFNPNDIEDLYRAMEQLFKDKAVRTRVLAQAPTVLARYSWRTHAQALMDLYRIAAR